MNSKRFYSGFTLIEILVVITIIMIVFGFAVPTISAFLSNRKLGAITGRLSRGLLQARARAITENNDIYVLFLKDRFLSVGKRSGPVESQPYFESDQESGNMRILFRFAGLSVIRDPKVATGVKSDLPPFPAGEWFSKPVSAKQFIGKLDSSVKPVFLLFKGDGSIQFGEGDGPGDVFSLEFMEDPPRNADIVVEEIGGKKYARGWIDVRATGNVSQKISPGTLSDDNVTSKER